MLIYEKSSQVLWEYKTMSNEEMLKRAASLLELYEKSPPSLKESIGFYLRQIHQDLVRSV